MEGKQMTTIAPSRTITYNTGFLTQFRWVLKRTFKNILLNPQTSVAQVGTRRCTWSRRVVVPAA